MVKSNVKRDVEEVFFVSGEAESIKAYECTEAYGDFYEVPYTAEDLEDMASQSKELLWRDKAKEIFYDELEAYDTSLYRDYSNLAREEEESEEYGRVIKLRAKTYWAA
ncbi:hypothetical protein [Proteiniclasticum ruminis]|uniref:hypothetical protein n=1 Tax=Proteiniclasticum ruminis TaxID=398199 RepID=UPI0028AB8AF3|nr:hypothetical protein [Proteiniclasticum ruminis]